MLNRLKFTSRTGDRFGGRKKIPAAAIKSLFQRADYLSALFLRLSRVTGGHSDASITRTD
jgi:hypothetical protein